MGVASKLAFSHAPHTLSTVSTCPNGAFNHGRKEAWVLSPGPSAISPEAMTTQVAAVFGVGPGLGAAVARRFAREGYAVALLARGEAARASPVWPWASSACGPSPNHLHEKSDPRASTWPT